MTNIQHYDICINGAGPIGTTLACLLAQKGMTVLLLERHPMIEYPNPALDGRAYALAEGIRPILEEAGIWGALPNPPQPIEKINVIDNPRLLPAHKTTSLSFLQNDAPNERPFGWMVEAFDLLASCANAVKKQPNLRLLTPAEGRFSFLKDEVSVQSGEEKFSVKLVIAADGRRSTLRQQAKIPLTTIAYHKCALVTVIAHQHPHHGSALEHFLPAGPFARLPLPPTKLHPHRSAIVITDQHAKINHLKTMPQKALEHYISERLCDEDLGDITHIGQRWLYPLSSQYAHSYIAKRLLLIGDAAHGLHPVAGQGMNVGFRDVKMLVPILQSAFHNHHDLGSNDILQQYQKATRPHNLAMLAGCDMMERLFSNKHPLLTHMRGLGLLAIRSSSTLRRKFILKAMGL